MVVERALSLLRHGKSRQSQLSPGEASLGFFIDSISGGRVGLYAGSASSGRRTPGTTRRLRRPALRRHFLERRRTDSRAGQRTNRSQMGHIPVESTLAKLAGVRRPRKIFLHINNTNPMLDEASPQYRQVRGAGWEDRGGWMAVQPVETETASQSAPPAFARRVARTLQATGEERYHHKHPFHLLMHEGKLSRGQLQAWALNRYYYQSIIPIKDSIILSRGPDPVFRRAWRKRVVDHDGDATSEGGIKRWIKVGGGHRARSSEVRAGKGILPATRFAVNEYLNIVRSRTLLEAVASSLTELFSDQADHSARGKIAAALSLAGGRSGLFRSQALSGTGRFAIRRELRSTTTRRRAPSRSWRSRPCATSATFYGPSSTRSTSPTCSRDGRRRGRSASRPASTLSFRPERRERSGGTCSLARLPGGLPAMILPKIPASAWPAGCRWGAAENKTGEERTCSPVSRRRDQAARHRPPGARALRRSAHVRRDHRGIAGQVSGTPTR
jgi:hypothetical protein